MHCQVILDRDLMKELEFKLLDPKGMIALNNTICEIMNIELSDASVVNEIIDSWLLVLRYQMIVR